MSTTSSINSKNGDVVIDLVEKENTSITSSVVEHIPITKTKPKTKKVNNASKIVIVPKVAKVNRKKKKRKERNDDDYEYDENGVRIKKSEMPFPVELKDITHDDMNCVTFVSEYDTKSTNDDDRQNIETVAYKLDYVVPSTGILYSLILNKMPAFNLRKLANKLGARGLGSCTKYQARRAIAECKIEGKAYVMSNITNYTSTTAADKNTKCYIRVINVVFHPENFEIFLTLNDRKDRANFEYSDGAHNKGFWHLISDMCNDFSNQDINTFINFSSLQFDNYEYYIKDAIDKKFSPTGGNLITADACRVIIEGLIKIRGVILFNMKVSGTNDNDPMHYTEVAIRKFNLTKTVSMFAAYYFFLCCTEHHNEVDSTLQRYLSDSVKSNSDETIADSPKKKRRRNEKLENKDNEVSEANDINNGILHEVKTMSSTFQQHLNRNLVNDGIKHNKDIESQYYKLLGFFTGPNAMTESNPQYNFLQKRLLIFQQLLEESPPPTLHAANIVSTNVNTPHKSIYTNSTKDSYSFATPGSLDTAPRTPCIPTKITIQPVNPINGLSVLENNDESSEDDSILDDPFGNKKGMYLYIYK